MHGMACFIWPLMTCVLGACFPLRRCSPLKWAAGWLTALCTNKASAPTPTTVSQINHNLVGWAALGVSSVRKWQVYFV